MSDLYWINVFGNISSTIIVLLILSAIGSIVTCIWFLDSKYSDYSNDGAKKCSKKLFRAFIIVFPILLCINVFLPSKEDLYTIYGVGTTIDYLKDSKEAKKLPDNAVKALNVYLTNMAKEDSIPSHSDR